LERAQFQPTVQVLSTNASTACRSWQWRSDAGLKILATEPFAASPAAWRARQLRCLRETQDVQSSRQFQDQLAAMDREANGARDVLQKALGEGAWRALCACCR
jgi:hypothetical protein